MTASTTATANIGVTGLAVMGRNLARNLAHRLSDAKLTVIEDAGHIPHIDQPDAVTTAISEFLHQPASQLSN